MMSLLMSRTHIPMYLKKLLISNKCFLLKCNISFLGELKSKLKYLGLSSFTTVFLSCIAAKDSLYTTCWRYWGFATNFLAFFSLLTSRTSLCLRTSSHVLPISVWIIFFGWDKLCLSVLKVFTTYRKRNYSLASQIPLQICCLLHFSV